MKSVLVLSMLQLCMLFQFSNIAKCDLKFCPFDFLGDNWYMGLLHDPDLYCTDGEISFEYDESRLPNSIPVYCSSGQTPCSECDKLSSSSKGPDSEGTKDDVPRMKLVAPESTQFSTNSDRREYIIKEGLDGIKFWQITEGSNVLYFETFIVIAETKDPSPVTIAANRGINQIRLGHNVSEPMDKLKYVKLEPEQYKKAKIAYKNFGVYNIKESENMRVISFKDKKGITHNHFVRLGE